MRLRIFALTILSSLSVSTVVHAQEVSELLPSISGPTDIAVGRTAVLDASSTVGAGEDAEYLWYRDGITQPISRSVEAVYTPEKAGTTVFTVSITTTIDGEEIEASAEHVLTIYDRKIALVADMTVPKEKLEYHRKDAAAQGVFLRILQPMDSTIPLGEESALHTVMAEESDALVGAESIVLWTEGVAGLQALHRALETDQDKLNALANQTIVLVSNTGLQTLARTVKGHFTLLRPDQIVITRAEALNSLFTTEGIDGFTAQLAQRDIDSLIVDETTTAVRPWNLLSSLVNYMLTHGVSSRTVILLLSLPIIATIIAFLKQVIGITTFGLYTPSVLALSFLALGWWIGVLLLLFILITGYATRSLMKRWRLLYIPKVAIILTVVSITLLLLLGIGAYFDLILTGDTIFILLIMSTLSESFLTIKSEQGLYSAVLGIGETILAALLCVFIVQWPMLRSMVMGYPELILLTLIINIFLGRWKGLRLVEYFRFREVFKHLQEE